MALSIKQEELLRDVLKELREVNKKLSEPRPCAGCEKSACQKCSEREYWEGRAGR